MKEEIKDKEIIQDEVEKALGYGKYEKPFWKRGLVYTEKPKKDVRFLQYLFLAAAAAVLVFAAVMLIDTFVSLF